MDKYRYVRDFVAAQKQSENAAMACMRIQYRGDIVTIIRKYMAVNVVKNLFDTVVNLLIWIKIGMYVRINDPYITAPANSSVICGPLPLYVTSNVIRAIVHLMDNIGFVDVCGCFGNTVVCACEIGDTLTVEGFINGKLHSVAELNCAGVLTIKYTIQTVRKSTWARVPTRTIFYNSRKMIQ